MLVQTAAKIQDSRTLPKNERLTTTHSDHLPSWIVPYFETLYMAWFDTLFYCTTERTTEIVTYMELGTSRKKQNQTSFGESLVCLQW